MFRARGCTTEEAADLAQEAAVRAFVHIRRWGVTNAGLDPLLNRIARNLLIDRYRRTTPHIVPLDDAGELHDPSQDPTEEVDRRQRSMAVHSAIRALPTRHQKAITYSLNGLSPEEVGRQMGIGRNAADALLHRARRGLKEHLRSAGEGMFGIALAVRVRWDQLTRRFGVQSGFGEAGALGAANSAMGAATAALIAVLAVTGGGGGAFEPHENGPGFIGGDRTVKEAVITPIVADQSAQLPALTDESVDAYTFGAGPARSKWNSDGSVDNQVSAPNPTDPSGPHLFDLDNRIWRDDGAPEPLSLPNVTPGPLVCGVTGVGC